MISYKDMTFCPYWKTCSRAHDCHRPMTPDVVQGAAAIGLPIAQFAEVPQCWRQRAPAPPQEED